MASNTLDVIGLKEGTDKSSSHHDYLRHYEFYLGALRRPIRNLLEIGVYDGGSLRMWSEFLPDAQVTGLDIDPRCLEFSGGNATVLMCDQSDAQQLVDVAVKLGPFDVIIDDGSHIWSHQILTFETLFPFVAPGGVFIIEDIDTSFGHYMASYGRDSTLTAAQYVTKIANYVLGSTAAPLAQEPDLRIRSFVPRIDSVVFIRRSAIIMTR